MGNHHLEVLIPAVISALLVWEGVQCRTEGYSVNVPFRVTVEDGLCSYIPCRFTYPESDADRHADLYGYWYRKDKQTKPLRLVATNDPERIKQIDPHNRHRFEISGLKLNSGDCSLIINDVEPADRTIYQFQIEKGHRKYSYSKENEKVYVNVTERRVDILFEEPLQERQKKIIRCETERCSFLRTPEITWTNTSQTTVLGIYRIVSHNRVESLIDFIPTAADHRQNVTCRVTYGEGSNRRRAEKTITLNVHYRPRTPWFRGQIQYSKGSGQNLPNGIKRITAKAGDTLVVKCEADANPTSIQTWVRTPLPAITQKYVSYNILRIYNLNVQHEGEYECEAKNQEGSSRAVLYLDITENDYTKGR